VFYDSSLKIGDQLFIIKDKIAYLRGIAQTYGDLGLAYYCLGDWNRAKAFYDKSLRGFEEINDTYGIAITKADLALLYKTQGKKKEAKKLFQEVLKFFEDVGDKPNAAITRKHLKDL
jgi:tetratricopeptide (TPR) repeat protein